MAIGQLPFSKSSKLSVCIVGEKGVSSIQQVDAAIESPRAGLRNTMGALGNNAQQSMLARQKCQDLRSFRILEFADANAAVRRQCHTDDYSHWRGSFRLRASNSALESGQCYNNTTLFKQGAGCR